MEGYWNFKRSLDDVKKEAADFAGEHQSDSGRVVAILERTEEYALGEPWVPPAFAYLSIAIENPKQMDVGAFQIVEGHILSTALKQNRLYLNFGRDWRTDYPLPVSPVRA